MPAKRKYTAAEKRAFAARMAKARARAAATRKTTTVRGRGFYKGFGRDLGTFVGGAIGSRVGLRAPFAAVGGYLGQKGADITGFGAYSVPHAMTQNTLVLPNNPRIKNDLEREGAVVVSHREHIGTVKSSTGFEIQYELPLNPAQDGTFPWLSSVAANFTQYEMLGCIFEYVSTSGSAVSSTNNALGEVIMTSNANSLDSSYVSKTQMLNSDFCQAFSPSSNGALPIECSPQQSTLTKLYTRYGAVKDGADIRMSDLGVVTIATSGMQAADIEVGELYVNYQVALLKPQLVEELGLVSPCANYQLVGATDPLPLGTPSANFDSIGVTFSGNVITIPRNTSGKFFLRFMWKGASTAVTYPNITAQANMTNVKLFDNATQSIVSNTGTTTTRLWMDHAFQLTDSSSEGTITLGAAGTLPTSLTVAELQIFQINYDMDEAV